VVNLTGTSVGTMKGKWIVTGVRFPMTVAGVVTVDCVRPIDPVIPPETSTASGTAGATKKTATGTTAAGGTRTASNIAVVGVDSFVAKYTGVAIDTDGAFGAQCVDLVSRFNTEAVGGPALFGNGNQWFDNPAANGAYNKYATSIAWGETASKGDIACWGSFYGGGYGHVAVVLEDLGNSLRVFTQNPGASHIDVLSKQGLQGYLRAKKWDTGRATNTGAVKWN
jgi:surface antigen